MRLVQRGPTLGLLAELTLLSVLSWGSNVGVAGWAAGTVCGIASATLLRRALARHGLTRLGPADWVTLARLVLVVGVAALTVDSLVGPPSATALVVMSAVALLLDSVDGWVARRTGTVSAFGARFDMEVDALLILLLSIGVAPAIGLWVLAIGGARYLFVAAGWAVPWLRANAPTRYWCKIVAAVQGVVLVVAASGVLPSAVSAAALFVALALLAESFGRDVWRLWRLHTGHTVILRPQTADPDSGVHVPPTHRDRAVGVTAVLGFGALLWWFALLAPNDVSQLSGVAFARIPLEGIVIVGLLLGLPTAVRKVTAVVAGLFMGVLSILKLLDMGFFVAYGRPSDPVVDWRLAGSAIGLLNASVGNTGAMWVMVGLFAVLSTFLGLLPWSVLRLSHLAVRHRHRFSVALLGAGTLWSTCALLGVQLVPGLTVASTSAGELTAAHVESARAGLQDPQTFAAILQRDPFHNTPTADLLTGLRGKDVIIAFVESYGKVAVQGSPFSPVVDDVLDSGTQQLKSAGFDSRSGWLTSSTFGGLSWLAHSTLQSGTWVDSQQRYDQLVTSDRLTLSKAFSQAGWRTVADVPSNEVYWPEGFSFYRYATVYDEHNVGYQGPKFSYASMPDQYIWSAFQRLELAKQNRSPVMAEIDLVSSHTPWAPVPYLVSWDAVGDGSIFDPMPAQGQSPEKVWRSGASVQAAYSQSIQYSLQALISFVAGSNNNNLVLVVVGDHQPATVVSGANASHDVPVSLITHDAAVLHRTDSWNWQDGLRPLADTPVWTMDSFRDRFLGAFNSD